MKMTMRSGNIWRWKG